MAQKKEGFERSFWEFVVIYFVILNKCLLLYLILCFALDSLFLKEGPTNCLHFRLKAHGYTPAHTFGAITCYYSENSQSRPQSTCRWLSFPSPSLLP